MRALLLLTALPLAGLFACRDACEQACYDFGATVRQCEDAFAEAQIGADCFPDPESAVLGDGSVDYEYAQICESGREAQRSCLDMYHLRGEYMDDAQLDDRLAVCEEDNEYNAAIAAQDCEALVALVGG